MDEAAADTLRVDSADSDRTVVIGRAVGRCCVAGDLVALDGELGAGKTQFVRGLAEGLGLDPRQVSSPTFVIMQEYHQAADPGRAIGGVGRSLGIEALVHLDAYRLRSAEDLASVGWEGDGASLREGAVVAVEWAALLGEALPDDRLDIRIDHEPAGRALFLTAHGGWRPRLHHVRDMLDTPPNA